MVLEEGQDKPKATNKEKLALLNLRLMLCCMNINTTKFVIFRLLVLRLALLFASILFSADNIFAQEEFIPPASRLLSAMPFRLLNGGIVLIKSKVGNYPDSLNFIFDPAAAAFHSIQQLAKGFTSPLLHQTERYAALQVYAMLALFIMKGFFCRG